MLPSKWSSKGVVEELSVRSFWLSCNAACSIPASSLQLHVQERGRRVCDDHLGSISNFDWSEYTLRCLRDVGLQRIKVRCSWSYAGGRWVKTALKVTVATHSSQKPRNCDHIKSPLIVTPRDLFSPRCVRMGFFITGTYFWQTNTYSSRSPRWW